MSLDWSHGTETCHLATVEPFAGSGGVVAALLMLVSSTGS